MGVFSVGTTRRWMYFCRREEVVQEEKKWKDNKYFWVIVFLYFIDYEIYLKCKFILEEDKCKNKDASR